MVDEMSPDPSPRPRAGNVQRTTVANPAVPLVLPDQSVPLPGSDIVTYMHFETIAGGFNAGILGQAPRTAILRSITISTRENDAIEESGWAIRMHSSLPATQAQFEAGPLVLPAQIRNPDWPGYAAFPNSFWPLVLNVNVLLPQGPPLLIFGCWNNGATANIAACFAVIRPLDECPK